jgi:hypothetical protein
MNTLDARKALLIVGAMTVHPFTEEVGLGVSFGDGMALGLFITLAIAVHYIPEGLAISLVLVPRGETSTLLSVSTYQSAKKGRLVGARGTAPEVVRYVILFPAHHGAFVDFVTKYSTLLSSKLLSTALGTATSLPRPTSPPAH